MSKTQYEMVDIRSFAADEGIDLPADEITNTQLRFVQLTEAIRAKKAKEARDERRWFWGKVFGLATLLLGGGAVTYAKVVPEPAPAATSSDVVRAVAAESRVSEKTATDNVKRIEKLAEIAIGQEETIVQSVEYIGKKIEVAHPNKADDLAEVEEPPALKKAKASIADRKRKAAAGRLLEIDTGP